MKTRSASTTSRRASGSTILDMSDDVLDAFDPLLPEFVLQHDFRERFFHALEEIVEVLDADDMTSEQRLVKIGILARGALDHESIKVWLDANRPMPWLDERVGDQAREITEFVLKSLDS